MNRVLSVAAVVLVAIGLSGCVSTLSLDPANPSVVAASIEVEANQYTGVTKVSGPAITQNTAIYLVRGWIDPGAAIHDQFQIYVTARFSDWAFLDRAYAGGVALDTTLIDREVGYCSQYGCTLWETVGVNISRADMQRFSQTGFDFQIRGRSGSVTVQIPPGYFAAVLAAHDALR